MSLSVLRGLDFHSDNAMQVALAMKVLPYVPYLYRSIRPAKIVSIGLVLASIISRKARRAIWFRVFGGLFTPVRRRRSSSAAGCVVLMGCDGSVVVVV